VEGERIGSEAELLVVESLAEVRWSWESGRLAMTREELRACLRARLSPGVVVASAVAVRLALSDVMRRLAATEGWLGVVLARGGSAWVDLVDAMAATLAEARRMTWHGSLTRDVWADPRMRTVAAAGRALERDLTQAGLLDPAAQDEQLAHALSRSPPEDVVHALGARRVLASGIASWLPAELALWRALDARLSLAGGAASIELVTFERPLDASRALDPLGRLVDAVAEALDAAPKTRPITPVLADFGGNDESSTSVELYRADGARAEASAIAETVHEALSAGTPPEQIAIVTPDTPDDAVVEGAIVRALADLGIAAHAPREQGSRAGGLVTCALEALAVAGRGVPRLALATLLRSPYLDARRVSGLADEPRAIGAIRRLARVLERTRDVAGDGPSDAIARTVLASHEADADARQTLAALVRRIGETLERAASGSRRAEHARRARDLVAALGLRALVGPSAAAHFANDGAARGLTRAEVLAFVRDAQGTERLLAGLEAYEAAAIGLGLDAPTSFESFRLEFEHALREDQTGSDAPSLGAVLVTPLRELPSRPLALLVLAGVHGEALESGPKSVTLLDAAARARLTETIEPALRPSVFAADGADSVRLASAAHATRKVVVSYTTREEDGALRPPHALVASLERRGVRQTTWRDQRVADEAPLGLARAIPADVAKRAAIEARREGAFGLGARPSDPAAGIGAVSAAVQAILAEETGGAERPMSVTALDRFGACLFQGFSAQVLGARKAQVLDNLMDPREEGILLHGALAAAFEATRVLWGVRPRDAGAIRTQARRAAVAFLGRDHPLSRQMRASLDEVGERVASVIEWSLADEAWDFWGAEAGFGKRADHWDAVLLHDDRAALRLTGSIDRVDTSQDRFHLRVVDYKRSEDGARRLTEGLAEVGFQLAVYARAASEALGKPVTSGAYLPTRRLSPEYRTRGSEAAWTHAHEEDHGLPRFERRALDLAVSVRHGDVEPRPSSPDVCRWCDHDGACRKPRFVILGSLADDANEAHAGA